MDYHLPGEWEIARDVELNPFKDVLVFRKMIEFLGAIPINLKENMWESEELIDKNRIELIDPDGEKFNKTFQSIPATRKLSEKENPSSRLVMKDKGRVDVEFVYRCRLWSESLMSNDCYMVFLVNILNLPPGECSYFPPNRHPGWESLSCYGYFVAWDWTLISMGMVSWRDVPGGVVVGVWGVDGLGAAAVVGFGFGCGRGSWVFCSGAVVRVHS
ncbi:hypothetical protein Tco_0093044 [Tanacetum coccineum]